MQAGWLNSTRNPSPLQTPRHGPSRRRRQIKRRLSRYGVDMVVIEQADGSLTQLPEWMLREAAALLGLRPEPGFPLKSCARCVPRSMRS